MGETAYRVGLIGGGRMGTTHARAYACNPRTQVAAVADTDAEVRRLFCERFGCRGYADYAEMLQKEDLDIAAPILPVRANADAVVAAAASGVKAVFCEKPLAGCLADADRMVEACRTRGVLLAAGLVAKNNRVMWQAKRRIEAGEIGELQCINIYCSNNQGGCHGINMARHFAGYPPVDWLVGWVSGDPQAEHEEPYEEGQPAFGQIGGHIRFANGVQVYSHFQVPCRGVEVVGSRGTLFSTHASSCDLYLLKAAGGGPPRRWEDMRLVGDAFEHEASRQNPDGTPVRDAEGWLRVSPTMADSIDTLVGALDRGAGADERLEITTGEDLRAALEICVGLRLSARLGQRPVRLPLEERDAVMYPEKWRWNYKKEIYGAEWYREQLANHKQ